MHSHGSKHFSSASKSGPQHIWQDGDVAFLKTSNAFNLRDYDDLIGSRYMHEKATCHPVIILKAASGGAIVTPVTAFSSGTENNFLPPWQQKYHRRKCLDDFRAFVGTRRPNNKHASLKLADPKMQMPKPQASWVYLGHFWAVPYSVLGWFNKAPSLLQVSKDSLAQLRQDIKQKYESQLRDALDRLGEPPAVAHTTTAPTTKGPPPESHAATPVMTVSTQQATGKVAMSYSNVLSGISGAVITQLSGLNKDTDGSKSYHAMRITALRA
ncbi:hypothetical protein VMCG_06262 [Cytospora schulzeri]|uniref:Uncharacterized protein n=1 Tax=Cytospora schulzeri TaxID=448051 RepID=A0A423W9B8_9PEZI|nr:hypothetical protein VMCG_06262 [Valsa malicola]